MRDQRLLRLSYLASAVMSLYESSNVESGVAPENKAATPEHCFYTFDALYCALTGRQPVTPKFPDEK